jgi:hypothetical protein
MYYAWWNEKQVPNFKRDLKVKYNFWNIDENEMVI